MCSTGRATAPTSRGPIEAFEKATGNKVVNDFFNSEQEMLTKLRTNPGLYDVVMINAAFNDQAMAEKLIQPIDTSKLPNYADISKDKAGSPMLDHDGKVYGVPWVWGLTALAINEKSFDKPPTSDRRNVGRGAQGPRRHSRRRRRSGAVRRHRHRPEHQRHQGYGCGQGEADLADAADQDVLEFGERLEPDGRLQPDRHRHLLERLGRPRQDAFQAAGLAGHPAGRRRRLARRLFHSGRLQECRGRARPSSTT